MDYSDLTVPQLKDILKEYGVHGYSGKRRDELIAMLEAVIPSYDEIASPEDEAIFSQVGLSPETEYPLIEETPPQEYASIPRHLTSTLSDRGPGLVLRKSDPRISKGPTVPVLRAELKERGARGYTLKTKSELESEREQYHPLTQYISPDEVSRYREDVTRVLEAIGWSRSELDEKPLGELEDILRYEQPPLRLPTPQPPRASRITLPHSSHHLAPPPSPFAPPTDNEIEDLSQRRLNIITELEDLGWSIEELRGKPIDELEEMLQHEHVIPRTRQQHAELPAPEDNRQLPPMDKLTITELRELAQEADIEDYALMSRSELLRILKEIASGMR